MTSAADDHHHDATAGAGGADDRFGAEHWDQRYAGEQVWSGEPNGALVAEVGDLPVGTALDVGCGEGADSLWLARRGWRVTALDISRRAVDHTLALAARAGLTVTGVASPLLDASLPEQGFDLVSAMYPVLARTDEGVAERRLQELVAPGGTLLVVHHEVDEEHARAHGFDPYAFVAPADVAARLTPDFEVVVDERRERHVASGSGRGHRLDIVLRARRRTTSG